LGDEGVVQVDPRHPKVSLMTEVVSKRQKVRFLLGLFDDHDQQYFDSSMFSKMMVALYHGIAAMPLGSDFCL